MSKNIIICLDGTGNQPGRDPSNIIKLYRMLRRESDKQITYYDPGVGTMGDERSRTSISKTITKWQGLAFGRGLMKNVMQAYTFLMDHHEDGDKVFIFGFSRGAYTARVLAAFIKECGLLERGAYSLFPYAMEFFHKKSPIEDRAAEENLYKIRSNFRSTYSRLLKDPKHPDNPKKSTYQLRIHFLGLFDTVKSYGYFRSPIAFRNEEVNPSVRTLRHAISIDEKRKFFPQMHWQASSKGSQDCKEVWFAGVHSDVGGGYPEAESGLAKLALEWMCHEAVLLGLLVDAKRYGSLLQKQGDGLGNWIPKNVDERYAHPDPTAMAHESLASAWKLLQFYPKKQETWEENNKERTIKNEQERVATKKELNPIRIHQSVIDRIKAEIGYAPKNINHLLEKGDYEVEQTLVINSAELKGKLPLPPSLDSADITPLTDAELEKVEAFKYTKGSNQHKPEPSSKWNLHRDAFVFASYVGGLRFVDLCGLTWRDFDGKNINLLIHSTSPVPISVTPKALEVLEKYKPDNFKPDDFIFPILNLEDAESELFQSRMIAKNITANKDLKFMGDKVGVPKEKRISFDTARHTWVKRARRQALSNEQISQILGMPLKLFIKMYGKA